MIRTSFSQNNMFHKCPRCWYYSYVKKVPVISDMSYAEAGKVIHKVLEEWYNKNLKNMDEAKALFNKLWKDNKLESAKWNKDTVNYFENEKKKSEYWLMIINGIDLQVPITTTELKIYFEDVLGYLDVVNTKEDTIYDWKSSTRREENEEEYTMQLMFYSYLYKRKFGRIPTEAGVFYLKYTGTKGTLVVHPTEQDIEEIEKWHTDIQEGMAKIVNSKHTPEMCDHCFFFCPHKVICESRDGVMKYAIHSLGNYIQLEGPITGELHKAFDKKFSYELKNAYFMKKANPNINTTIRFWDYNNRKLPIGFKKGLINTLTKYAEIKKSVLQLQEKEYREFDDTKVEMPDKLKGIELRDYQKDIIDHIIKEKISLVQSATGSGKTVVMAEVIRRLGMKTLVVVDKIELLNQTKKVFEKTLGLSIGKIGQGDDDIKDITIATIQTLYKNLGKYSKYLNTIRFVIYDECHKISARSFWRLSHHLNNTEYRAGMCLHFQTNVFDEKGHIKNIREVKVGDGILSYNHKEKKVEKDIVLKTYKKEVDEVLRITIRKKNGNLRKIKCSSDHKFFIDGKYIKAKNLGVGDKVNVLLSPHSKYVCKMIEELEIVKIEKIKNTAKKTRIMYDLQTKKNHNFFANGILVHNSGTCYRDDGNDLMINATVGYKSYELNSEKLIDEGWLMKPTITFIKGFMTDEFKQRTQTILNDMKVNPTKDYAEYYHGYISSNTERNSVIERLADKYRGKKILILVKLVDHGKELEEAIPGSRYLHGSIGKEERAEMFEQFTRGKLDVLIATIGIASEGLDIPVLDIVINAAANKGDVKTIQILGRVLRKLEGKENARYIDFVDDIDFFRQASYNRMRILKEEGHDVEVKEWEALMKSF